MKGVVGARSSPPTTIGNLFIALMTLWWIHLETDLLMSGESWHSPKGSLWGQLPWGR